MQQAMMRMTAVLGLLAGAAPWPGRPAHAPLRPALATATDQPAARPAAVPPMVLTFYYPWYGNPAVPGGSGRWSHWHGVDEAGKQIASSTHYPRLGPYDSHDHKLIAQHCQWAKQAGIDAFIASWWGHRSFSGRALARLLDGCAKAGLTATIYYEQVPGPKTPQAAADDIVKLLKQHGGHPAWLKVDGKPVVFIYGRAVGQLGLERWSSVIEQVNREYKGGAIFIGDRTSRAAARIFDGIHTYNTAGALRGKPLDQVRAWARQRYTAWVAAADAFGRISAVTVIPGYDDTKIRRPGLRVERRDGQLYRTQWEEAIAANPHWVLITSWNEWHEGSEIEPSEEYGSRYLALTAEYSRRFKSRGLRGRGSRPK